MATMDEARQPLSLDSSHPRSLIPGLQPGHLQAMWLVVLCSRQPQHTETTPWLEGVEGTTGSCPTNKCVGRGIGRKQSRSQDSE